MRVQFNVKSNLRKLAKFSSVAATQIELAMNDVADDLVRTSSETAPHDKGILEKSSSKEVKWSNGKIEATVEYSVKEENSNGGFNYALKMHEDQYQLGERSRQKDGGTGMSGKHYEVGNKFLTRILEGEASTYREHIIRTVNDKLR
jgi:hypothetical protein